jgi:hypothetical protein
VYSIDGGSSVGMTASDGNFDQVSEDVEADVFAFPQGGVHEFCIFGTDAASNDGPEECVLLAVYDPNGGFVTGGGWIYSEVGWCQLDLACAEAEGKANFGFVSKYKKGATTPTGQTEFQFKAGDLNFHSSSYEWMVVNQGGTNAQFKGAGTINGEGTYRFMLWAGDGDPDTFRIRIWEEDGDGIETDIYDNGFDQELGGGSIVIHTKKK